MRPVLVLPLLVACTKPTPSEQPTTCEQAPQWRYEKIELPPDFAPSLPAGAEILWFAPGMFEPDADDYFTYAFQLDFNAQLRLDGEAIDKLLFDYYTGLMTAVGGSQGRTPGPVQVRVDASPSGRYFAMIELTDEFTGGEEITIAVDLEVAGTCLLAFATAKPSAENARALAQTRPCLPCTR